MSTDMPKRFPVSSLLVSLPAVLLILLTAIFAQPAQAIPPPQEAPPLFTVDAFPGERFVLPVDIVHAGDERLFVVEQPGVIRVLEGSGPELTNNEFLDIHGRVATGSEMGLLGLAFHPEYQQNGCFFVNYTRLVGEQRQSVISRFQVTADPDRADPNSELILLTIDQPYANHNGGGLAFGPDGLLYIGIGDGGGAGDPDNRAQDGAYLLGKMLRIDVDNPTGDKNYGIPADNPFVGRDARDEIWATGLRNPWRFSFDTLTGDLYTGDVGQNNWEEINHQPAGSSGGQNYGWRLKEGTHCYLPEIGCDPGGLTDPIYEYSHTQGCSVTGGTVYRGSSIPELYGIYLYADYCTGLISALHHDGPDQWRSQPILKAGQYISTFGQDYQGEITIALRQKGQILRLLPVRGQGYIPFIPN